MAATRLLIVDDQISVRTYFKELLKPLAAEITEAADGREGLALALEGRFDAVITDYDMPRLNGVELCRRLKADSRTLALPIIMVSTFDADHEIDHGFQAGACFYLSKRKAGEQLLEIVKKSLHKARFQRERSILVIDDSPVVRSMIEKGLQEAGFQVITAMDSKGGREVLAAKKPDLILCDINMPGMDGSAFCRSINTDPGFKDIPFVAMSSLADRSQMRRMMQGGAASYIVKPFNLDQLVILVEKLLSDQFLLLLKERERLDTERRMLLAGITSLVSALEVRDQYTRGHSEAVAEIITGMMTFAGAEQSDIETAALGGRLHDIGKIGIRDGVLRKPGPLTKAEYDHIRMHPRLGADILKPIPSLAGILPIVLHHHERVDGGGYPDGLKKDAIPDWARMAAVADTYNALTSNRSYRQAMPRDKAFQILVDARGSQLCPEYVDLFLQWIDSAVSIAFRQSSGFFADSSAAGPGKRVSAQ